MKKFLALLCTLGLIMLTEASGLKGQSSCNFIITGQVNSSGGNPLPGITVNYTGVSASGGPTLTGTGYTNFYGQFYLSVPAPVAGSGGNVYIFHLNLSGCDTGISVPAFTLTPNNCNTPFWTGTTTLPACDTGPCTTSLTVNPSIPQPGQAVTITASGTGSNISPSSVVLYENAAPIAYSTGNSVTWTAPGNGNPPGTGYDLCVAAHYPGCVNVACENVIVIDNPACIGHYFDALHTLNGNTLDYNAYYWGNASSGAATILWDFGDGNTSSQFTGTHTYLTGGTYTVCGTITWSNGCTITDCFTITVSGSGGGGNNCAGYSFEANALVGGGTLSYWSTFSPITPSVTWSFGDGSSALGPQGYHQYMAGGTYTVCATATWPNGCVMDTCFTVVVSLPAPCQASLTISPASNTGNYLDYVFTVNNLSTGITINQVAWNVTNYTSFTTSAPTTNYTFPGPGGYEVCAVVSFSNGCTYTVCDSVLILNPIDPCTNYQIVANAVPSTNSGVVTYWVSLLSPTPPASVLWLLPNGNTANGYQGTFTFNAGGTITLCAVATWPNGCVDTSCVTLILLPNTGGSICGCVQLPQASAMIPADAGTAYLVQYNPFNNTLNALATTGISNGQFCFQNVQPGAYLVKAALAPASPYYWNYVPTYYSDVPFWWQATQIVVAPNNLNVNVGCITMIPGINPGGPGFIGGSIFQGANKSAPGDPVPNVEVLLLNMDDSPVAYTYSNHLGQYSFSNLPYGTYKVWPEQAGIPTTPAIVTIGPDNPAHTDINIALMSTGFVGVQAVGQQSFDVTVGPNPASDRLWIRFNQNLTHAVELSLTDMQGRVLISQWFNPASNMETFLDFSRIPSGLYQLTLKGQGQVSTFKVARP